MADELPWSMEELTLSNDEHGTPDEDMECMATMEDITIEDKNYCEYQTGAERKVAQIEVAGQAQSA